MPRPLVARISISAMRHNLEVARRCAPVARAWAVVKADAYGHGIGRAMRGFADADGLALIELERAVWLRESGWTSPILLLEGFFAPSDIETVALHQFNVTVHCEEQLAMLESARLSSPIDVHLKLNSGMNRLGFRPAAFSAAHARLRRLPFIRRITLMTHFANADEPDNPGMPLEQQLRTFHDAAAGLDGDRSLANSAAVLLHGGTGSDWIRPGIMLYGATPGTRVAAEFGLQPVMTLSSELIGIQHVTAGEAVGYGSRFIASRDMTLGVVACGYADGYPRHAPDGTPVLVNGQRTGVVGRVSMDMLSVDITHIPSACVGSTVTLWGHDLPIDEVANAAGTIGYELMCALAPRVPVVEVQ